MITNIKLRSPTRLLPQLQSIKLRQHEKEAKDFFRVHKSRLLLLTLCTLISVVLLAQERRTVTGTITDKSGERIIGASVFVKGTTIGTVSDIDGNFTLEVPDESVITVSYIGYLTQEIAVEGRNKLQIVLQEDTRLLDEVVVVGYGVMRKKDLTGAVASVQGEILRDKPLASLGEALQGRAAGVQVISSGKPGDNVSFRIRGISTINNSEPLLVIDGVPTDLGINALNMEDVERVVVLKDASATAIYGSRGPTVHPSPPKENWWYHSPAQLGVQALPTCRKCVVNSSSR